MVVIELTQKVATDAELTALTGMANQHIVWHTGISKACIYEANFASGDYTPDVDSGVWIIDEGINGLDLAAYKDVRYEEIDERTKELIADGFTYDSRVFSLSEKAQLNWIEIHSDPTAFTFPLTISCLNSDTYDLAEANVNAFWSACMTKLNTHLDSGRSLKKQVFDAVNESAVQAIIDTR